MKKILIPTVLLSAAAPLVSNISCKSQEQQTFETDSWENICNYINIGGANKLCKVYGFESRDELCGKTRKITLDGVEYEVIVIGVNEDVDKNNTVLTLTFQFKNLISDKNGRALFYKWNNDLPPDFPCTREFGKSDICMSLNDDGMYEVKSIYEMLKETDNFLAQNIKMTHRRTADVGQPKGDYKFFLPGVINLVGEWGKPNWYDAEGIQYKWYKNHPGAENLIKTSLNGVPYEYWLQSTFYDASQQAILAHSINHRGRLLQKEKTSELAIAPCFCL